jgi:hypothetical protein
VGAAGALLPPGPAAADAADFVDGLAEAALGDDGAALADLAGWAEAEDGATGFPLGDAAPEAGATDGDAGVGGACDAPPVSAEACGAAATEGSPCEAGSAGEAAAGFLAAAFCSFRAPQAEKVKAQTARRARPFLAPWPRPGCRSTLSMVNPHDE